jgi:hypothetical protein
MATNKYRLITLLFVTSLFLIKCDCKKLQLDCTKVQNEFVLPVKSYPNKDSINLGDTIFLEINESISFVDIRTNQTITFNGAENLGSAIGFQMYDSVTKNWLDAVDQFFFFLTKGRESANTNNKLYKEYLFSEQNGLYLFKLGVVPKQNGLFRLVFSNSNNTYRKDDKCTKANFTINFKETNHNRHLVGYTGPDVQGGDLNFYVK